MARQSAFSRSLGKARDHLAECDPILGRLMDAIGPCTLKPGGNAFAMLVRAIVSQMISTKAALAIFARLGALLPGRVTPAAVLALSEDELRGVGLSRTKAGAIRDLATHAHEGKLNLNGLRRHDEAKAIERLTAIRGIGPWTAQMYLMFGLGRLNVLPVADFGLRAAVREHYELQQLPSFQEVRRIAEPWHPYCTIATWYLWRSRGLVPQSS